MERYLDYPFQFDSTGRSAATGADDHVRDMIYQVLFTNPGERVNRPDFGCGLLQTVFAPNSGALAAATQFLVHGALQRWLSEEIVVEDVAVESQEERLVVEISYLRRDTGQRQTASFSTGVGGSSGGS
ncbi:MAG: GPW/gp25 family protein [Anaerolineales bacterium]